MYPTEYRWISAPTPVTIIVISSDNWSIRYAKSICKSPAAIHEK